MRSIAPLAVLAVIATAVGCAEDPLFVPGECTSAPWRQRFVIDDALWTDGGAVSADNGENVLVVWQQRFENADDNDHIMAALLDSKTGEVVRQPEEIASLAVLAGFDVIATAEGFLVSFTMGDVVSMRLLDARGEPRGESLRVETLGFTRDLVVAGDDATTLINWGIEVRSIDGDGQLLSTETPVPTESHCLSAARVGRGRLIAWCIDFENDDNGDPFLLDMDLDGTDSIIRPLDPQFADAHQVRLAFAGGQLFAAFGVDHDVFVAVFAEDGSLIAEPRRVGGAEDDEDIPGNVICTDTCGGLSIAAVGDSVLVGFEAMKTNMSWERRIELVNVAADENGVVVNGRRGHRAAHAHTATSTASGPLVTWIDTTGFHFPWEWPPQAIQVERSCNLVDD